MNQLGKRGFFLLATMGSCASLNVNAQEPSELAPVKIAVEAEVSAEEGGPGKLPQEEEAPNVEETTDVEEVPEVEEVSAAVEGPTEADPAVLSEVLEEEIIVPLIEVDPLVLDDPYWTPEVTPIDLESLDEEIPIEDLLEEEEPEDEEIRPRATASTLANPTYRQPGTLPGNSAYTFNGQPTGFDNAAVFLPPGNSNGELLKGFNASVNLTGTYNSNITQATGTPADPISGDFILGFGGTVSYLSTARFWTFGGNYSASYNQYLDNTNFSGFNQSAGLVANYKGSKLTATLNTGFSAGQGANRNFASSTVVDTITINSNLSARYAYSAKTSITANAGYGFTTASGGNFDDTSNLSLGMAALWKYSALTEFGPGIRYTANFGGSSERTSIGPTLNVNYTLSSKVSLNSRVGLDFTSFSNGGSSDPTTSALIGLNYNPSRLWGMDLSLFRDSRADASASGAFTQVTALRLGYTRKIRRASLNLGVSYEVSTTENSSSVAGGGRPDRDFFSLDASLGMAIFRNTTQASIFYRYSDQSAGATESFDSSQLGFSLSRSF